MLLAGRSPRIGKSSLPVPSPRIELHEDEVPELEVAVAGLLDVALGPVLRPAVEQDLRARAAQGPGTPIDQKFGPMPSRWMRSSGRPAIFFQMPDRLVVLVVDRRVQGRLRQPVAAVGDRLGDQVPGGVDRALFEVVAEGEVAVHLEERQVPRGLADLLDVERPHALLHADGTLVRRRLLAEEVGLERHHAGVDEQQVRVVQQQRCAGNDRVVALAEMGQEPAADLSGVHVLCAFSRRVRRSGVGWSAACDEALLWAAAAGPCSIWR